MIVMTKHEVRSTEADVLVRRRGCKGEGFGAMTHGADAVADDYEEVTAAQVAAEREEAERAEAYEAEVERLIRARYSASAELALLRQRDVKPDEFAAYNAYAEECKARAREGLS